MAIQVGGTTVIDDNRNLVNIVSGAGVSTGTSLPSTATASAGDMFALTTTGVVYIFNSAKSVWEPIVVTPVAAPNTVSGSQTFSGADGTDTTTSWTVPTGVYNFCAVAVGCGGTAYTNYSGGGGGGSLAWVNHVPCNPGDVFTVFCGGSAKYPATGTNAKDAYIMDSGNVKVVHAQGGGNSTTTDGAPGGIWQAGDGGGNGGHGGLAKWQYTSGGGGGAGGYSGAGGSGAGTTSASGGAVGGGIGAGGGGGGGGAVRNPSGYSPATGGGGVGLLGEGSNGLGGSLVNTSSTSGTAYGAGGGSGGASTPNRTWSNSGIGNPGGDYGGGQGSFYTNQDYAGKSGVRIVWKTGAANVSNYGFPSTNVN